MWFCRNFSLIYYGLIYSIVYAPAEDAACRTILSIVLMHSILFSMQWRWDPAEESYDLEKLDTSHGTCTAQVSTLINMCACILYLLCDACVPACCISDTLLHCIHKFCVLKAVYMQVYTCLSYGLITHLHS